MNHGAKRVALFNPRRVDDLREGVAEWIGAVLEFSWCGVVDWSGPFADQNMWHPPVGTIPCAWVPDDDLTELHPKEES